MKILPKLNTREYNLFVVTIVAAVMFLAIRSFLLPVYRDWQTHHAQMDLHAVEYAKLRSNLAVKDQVDQYYQCLGQEAWQTDSDQITLAQCLREIEAKARLPHLNIIHMKPLPVRQESTCTVYPVKLVLSGYLPELVQFVTSIQESSSVTGLEEVVVRGVQGYGQVECALSLYIVKLKILSVVQKPADVQGQVEL